MLVTKPYLRERAVSYARKYAFGQNPIFGNFRGIGGNCTNFVSQCIYAGSCTMNYTPTFGWYYISLDDRSPSWTGVQFFYNFIIDNKDVGPYGREASLDEMEIGDVIQLGNNQDGFYHTLLIVGFEGEDPLVAAQTDDAYNRPLSSYNFDFLRAIKILGVRLDVPVALDCFQSVYEGIAIVPAMPSGDVGPLPMPDGGGTQGGQNEPLDNTNDANPTEE